MTTEASAKAARTRRDIVQAAIECWAADSSASLGDVAQLAGVGRTTVNRYFSDRGQLIVAVDDECRGRFSAAALRARSEEGSGLEALQRLCVEIVDLGEVLGLIFADNALVDPDTWDDDEDADPLGQAIARGQSDGTIAADLPPGWIGTVVWTTLFAAWLTIKSEGRTRHEASLLLSRTLATGLSG